jgi:hypothetical protein
MRESNVSDTKPPAKGDGDSSKSAYSTSVSGTPDKAGNWLARITISGGNHASSTGFVKVGSLSNLLSDKK